MEMMDLRKYSAEQLDRLKFEMSCRENMNAVSQITDFQRFYGKTVTVVKGRKVPHGTTGNVFWMGSKCYSPYGDPWGIYTSIRVGIKDKAGNTFWTSLDNIQLAPEQVSMTDAPAAKKPPVKKYRVNESECFNLHSMYDHLKAMEIEMEESGDYSGIEDLQARITEVDDLLNKAAYVGSLVDWPTLKRIREIKEERQMIRYTTCLAAGSSEQDAALAFTL